MHHELVDNIKTFIDAASISVLIGTLSNIIPAISSLLTAIWMLIRITEHFKNKNKKD